MKLNKWEDVQFRRGRQACELQSLSCIELALRREYEYINQ